MTRLRGSSDTGSTGAWVAAHQRAIRVVIVVAGALTLLFWTRPTGWVVFWVAVVAGLLIALTTFLAAPPAAASSAGPLPSVPAPREGDDPSVGTPDGELVSPAGDGSTRGA